jgi:hypothetical protein
MLIATDRLTRPAQVARADCHAKAESNVRFLFHLFLSSSYKAIEIVEMYLKYPRVLIIEITLKV